MISRRMHARGRGRAGRGLLAATAMCGLLAAGGAASTGALSAPANATSTASAGHFVLGAHDAAIGRLERRLAFLHYDVGNIDGVFTSDTLHALVAFQKVQGLARTGTVTRALTQRLAAPLLPRLRYIGSGSGLEVDLSKQVLYRASGGTIVAIYDTSTGRPALPTPVSGAHPFRIWRRVLWGTTGYGDVEHYVQYYRAGSLLALHAYGYVPAYPDSHGCIRLTPGSAARVWASTYLGERLYTYY